MKKIWGLAACAAAWAVMNWGKARAQESWFLSPPSTPSFAPLMTELKPWSAGNPGQPPEFQAYLRFYGMDFPGVGHQAGWVQVGGERVFAHVMRPEVTRGTVVAYHGYFVHSALLRPLFEDLLLGGWTVVAVDLPGHGLSGGARVSIDNFSQYADTVEQVTQVVLPHVPKPYTLLGHSTGGAGVWEYLLQHPDNPYRNAILAAPLVRSYLWDWSLVGFQLGQGWISELPRLIRPTSSDPEFLAMVRKDPLQYAGTPVQWVRALIHWNEKVIEAYPPSTTPVLLFQGTGDTVVEWEYNLRFLGRKFPRLEVVYLKDALHDLLWEAPPIRTAIFERSLTFLNQTP
ncbi:MAG: alpha/beta hydrolase [Candidatus Sericytochromatia bacterium]